MEFRATGARPQRLLWVFIAIAVIAGLLPLVLIGRSMWGSVTLAYRLTPDAVEIEYGPTPVRINRDDIASAEIHTELTRGVRVGGTAMPGLYDGRWQFAETGRISLYASSRKPMVVLREHRGQVWGITPADPEGFLAALEGGRTGEWAPKRDGSPWGTYAVILTLVPLLFLVIPVLLYYMRLPEQIRYTLTEESLVVSGGRVRLVLPYGQISRVQAEPIKGGPFRKFGAALPGLLWGKFHWRQAGGAVELYATRQQPLVLITAGTKRVGITPEEQERFVAELSRRMTR